MTTKPAHGEISIKMMQADFEKITKQIEDAYRDPFTEDQFSVWYEQFKNEDYRIVQQATDLLLSEYKFFPVPATLWAYIKQVQDIDKAKEESVQKLEAEASKPVVDRKVGQRWARFAQYMLETDTKMLEGKTHEQASALKAEFERKHPNWQPRSRRKEEVTKPEPVKDILEDVFGEM